MSGREQGGASLVMLGAFLVVAAVLVWALWPQVSVVLERLQEIGR